MTIEIRFTDDIAEKRAAYRLRYELFVKDQGLFHDQADHTMRILTDHYDETARLLIAIEGGEIVGTLRLLWGGDQEFSKESRAEYDIDRFLGTIQPQDIMVVTRMVLSKSYRGKDLALRLTYAAFEFMVERKIPLILGTCEAYMLHHYIPWGFRPFGSLCNHPTNGARLRIGVVMSDIEHFQKLNSPMLSAVQSLVPSQQSKAILADLTRANHLLAEQLCDFYTFKEHIHACLSKQDGFGALLKNQELAQTLLKRSILFEASGGEAIFQENHKSRTVYLLLQGSLTVVRQGQTIARIDQSGELVGEVAFFTHQKRSVSVFANQEGAQLLAFNDRTLRQLLQEQSIMASTLFMTFTQAICKKLQAEQLVRMEPKRSNQNRWNLRRIFSKPKQPMRRLA